MSETPQSDARDFLGSTLSAIFPIFEPLTFTDSGDPSRKFTTNRENGLRSLNAILNFGREANGDVLVSLDIGAAAPIGFVMTFESGADTSATVVPPSFTLQHEDGSTALVYLVTGETKSVADLRRDLEPVEGDRYTLSTLMPLPFGDWFFCEEDEALVEAGKRFPVLDCTVIEAAFFTDGDVSASDAGRDAGSEKVEPRLSSETDSEETLRARLIEALGKDNLSPAQIGALKFAGRGFFPIPVHGIVKAPKDPECPKTKKLECACQSGKRWVADKNRKETVEACISPGKHPTISDWQGHNAIREADGLIRLFDPKYNKRSMGVNDGLNIGLVTGPATGLLVLDIDGEEGRRNLAALEKTHGKLPSTVAVVTGSGGRHYYFRAPTNMTILNSASKIAPKIDFRGEHGFVVAPPSKHISGGSYRWEKGCSPDDLTPADMPDWLINLALEGGEMEGAEKPGKGKRTTTNSAQKTSGGSQRTSSNTKGGWKGYLAEIGDHEGGRGFNGPIFDAMRSYFRWYGYDADDGEFLEALREVWDKADKSKGERDKYEPSHRYIAEQIEKARKLIRDTPNRAHASSSDFAVSLGSDGTIQFTNDAKFEIRAHEDRDWLFSIEGQDENSGENWGWPVCPQFKVLRVAKDSAGGSATITIGYDTRHDGPRELTFPMGLLYERAELLKLLRSNFFPMENENGLIELFKKIDLPVNTIIVEEPGWRDGGFLNFDGTYLPAVVDDDAETDSPRLKHFILRNVPQEIVVQSGSCEGWKEGIGRIFTTDHEHLEPFQFGLFTGGAGFIASLIATNETPGLNLGGETRHGKTTACMFGASVLGSPVRGGGVLRKCSGTANAMETEAVRYGGGTNYFDEGKLMAPDHFGAFRWRVAEGRTKSRLRPDGTARPTAKISGMSITTVEIGAIAHAESGGKKQPDGLRSRVVEISFDGITKLQGAAKDWIFGKSDKQGEDERVLVAGAEQIIKANFGWGWRPIVEYLQNIGPDRAAGEVEHYATLIDPKAEGVQRAQAKIVALVWYSGVIMRELGFLPQHVTDDDIERVIRWAWARRSEDSMLSPFNKAMVALKDNSMLMRGNSIVSVDAFDDRFFGDRLGYIWEVEVDDLQNENAETAFKAGQAWLCVPKKDGRLATLCEASGKTGKDIVQQMEKLGLIAYEGKKRKRPYFSRLPKSKSLSHYRINLAKLDDYVAALADDANDGEPSED